jgi:23S rRNA pseudouridine1911/1915/1917 synthase
MSAHLSVPPNPRVPYEVIHTSRHFAIINKPSGVVTQPGIGHERDALLNGLFHRWGAQLQNLGKRRDFGLLHRLDRGASGLIAIGLTPEGYDHLRAQFEQRDIHKEYWAVIHGHPKERAGHCDWPIEELRREGKKRALVRRGPHPHPTAQPALTLYRVLSTGRAPNGDPAALIACRIETGRLHQIRAHMSALGHPIIGDHDYGPLTPLNIAHRERARGALALHAIRLKITDPTTHTLTTFIAPPPPHFKALCAALDLSVGDTTRAAHDTR